MEYPLSMHYNMSIKKSSEEFLNGADKKDKSGFRENTDSNKS